MIFRELLLQTLLGVTCSFIGLVPSQASVSTTTEPLADTSAIFQEQGGLIAVEAEHFFKQTMTDVRAFHITCSDQVPSIAPDGDPEHIAGASGGAYLEILPDTRRTHGDKLIRGENYQPAPGKMAVLHYKVHFNQAGRYYVWARAYSTGSEDNGLHVGLDGNWPVSGQRLQWCEEKNTWRWESKQRTQTEHCGEPYKIFLDVEEPGEHIVQFSMREDGFEFDKWLMTTNRTFSRPPGSGPSTVLRSGTLPEPFPFVARQRANQVASASRIKVSRSRAPMRESREQDGGGSVVLSGDLKQWHKITIDLEGPYAHEKDNDPNPFTDYNMVVTFTHDDGTTYKIPGYFAADGNAADTSAEAGTVWRAHFTPDRTGQWTYQISFRQGKQAALEGGGEPLEPFHGARDQFRVAATDKEGSDLRASGRLQYVGKHYLRFGGSGKYFLKVGADAPETLLAYEDFDNTIARNPQKAPLKSWSPHLQDWNEGDPTWQDGKGKGLIGAINYLSNKGCNAFSFLTYNAGGDGDNVWPFIARNNKLHYDCSKLDQWGIVFDHGTAKGMYLHFKMQETENDDNRYGQNNRIVPVALDGGDLGPERKLYCRELIARFGHNLALNWNLGEENTQTTAQKKAMIDYVAALDSYDHNIVVHTFPNQQDQVYRSLLGDKSKLTGLSLQNSSLGPTHAQTVKWVTESAKAGKPWVVAFDESGSAAHGQCPDLGYKGFDGRDRSGKMIYTEHEVRKRTLWGTLMAGGAGNEYYFGYQFVENDLLCEDWRSRDRSWDYCRIAINFFHDNGIPFWEMTNADDLVGNPDHEMGTFCFAKPNSIYLVYLPDGGTTSLDLSDTGGSYDLQWFDPRHGGVLQSGSVATVQGGNRVELGTPPSDETEDWLVVVRCSSNEVTTAPRWQKVIAHDQSRPVQRHEAGYVRVDDRFYLLGGRRIEPVCIYDPIKNVWTEGARPPVEIHHFQPVVVGDQIYVAGAFTGAYPGETPLDHIYIYDTKEDRWQQGPTIPSDRLRGSTGNVIREGKLYMASGLRDGHRGDHKTWFDSFDLKTGKWQQLADCPRARDHHQAAVVENRLYLVGGRQSNAPSNVMGNTTAEIDVYDFSTDVWETLDTEIPTQRAGLYLTVIGPEILAVGGESLTQRSAHSEVEAFNTETLAWRTLPPLLQGRHGTGVIQFHNNLYIASGSGNRGGGPELTTQESISFSRLFDRAPSSTDQN